MSLNITVYCLCVGNGGKSYTHSKLSFLFSLRNKENLAPFIANVKPGNEQYAVYCNPSYGPSFGGGHAHDLHISNNANGNQGSYSGFGNSYQPPPGTVEANSLLAGSRNFTPTEIEVFI
jgi:hypothetical protein